MLELTSSTSYAGHGFGALAGICIGVFLMKNRKVEDWEVIFQWIAFSLFGILLCLFVIWHIAGTSVGWFQVENWDSTMPKCIVEE